MTYQRTNRRAAQRRNRRAVQLSAHTTPTRPAPKPAARPAVRRQPVKAAPAAPAVPRVHRHVSLPGFLLLLFLAAALGFLVGKGITWLSKDSLKSSDWLEVDGDFADSTEYQLIENTEETTAPADETLPSDGGENNSISIADGGDDKIIWSRDDILMPAGCVPLSQEQKDLQSGVLLQLDATHAFKGTVGTLTTFAEKNDSYRMKSMDLQIRPEVVSAMNEMARAYENVTYEANLLIYSTTEPNPSEYSLYADELPDRVTGYTIDLSILNEDGTISRILDPMDWLENNAWRYGFVRSYTDAEAEVTGIGGAAYHFRYVGKAHAGVMHEEGLTLSAYIEALHDHRNGNPYSFDDGNDTWYVYYVPADSTNTTPVPVPRHGNYEISGNNTDGYVVTSRGKIG